MRDFTYTSYKTYIEAIQFNNIPFYRFSEYFSMPTEPEKFCLVRHDVDRKPHRALKMAILENHIGIKTTYFFRTKPHTFKPYIIKAIYDLGHEIGYHYESLSDTGGIIENAIIDFEYNLNKLRNIAPVKTCAMHGRPFENYDNRDIWRIKENHEYFKKKLNIMGEVYLDIDYSNIAYINDTGRNWTSRKGNLRDKVYSTINADFKDKDELLFYLLNNIHEKNIFQIHPERWNNNIIEWFIQLIIDYITNIIKNILQLKLIIS